MICIWSTDDTTATPLSLASLKSRLVSPFWCRLTQVVLEKWPLNECLFVLCCITTNVALPSTVSIPWRYGDLAGKEMVQVTPLRTLASSPYSIKRLWLWWLQCLAVSRLNTIGSCVYHDSNCELHALTISAFHLLLDGKMSVDFRAE